MMCEKGQNWPKYGARGQNWHKFWSKHRIKAIFGLKKKKNAKIDLTLGLSLRWPTKNGEKDQNQRKNGPKFEMAPGEGKYKN